MAYTIHYLCTGPLLPSTLLQKDLPTLTTSKSISILCAMDFNSSSPYPEGVISFLDTDLYKLTMQCAVFQYFRDVPVTYAFTNRTPEKKLSREAYKWLEEQITSVCPFCALVLSTLPMRLFRVSSGHPLAGGSGLVPSACCVVGQDEFVSCGCFPQTVGMFGN